MTPPTVVPVALPTSPYPVLVGDALGPLLAEVPLPAAAATALMTRGIFTATARESRARA